MIVLKEDIMNKELIAAIEALEKENGISREIMFEAIEKSLLDEYKTQFGTTENVRIVLDRKTGDFHIYSDRVVVEELEGAVDPKLDKVVSGTEIALATAREIDPKCEIGDVITVEVKSEEFSRKAAKTAKNGIVQTIRTEEKAALFNEYHSKEKEIITGVVQRIDENGNILVDIGKTQTVLKVQDQVRGEVFERGDRIKLYVASVMQREKGSVHIKVSRSAAALVERLFEEEVTEIRDGIVEIMGIAREAGSRTKIAVRAKVPNVDPVGACVGINGSRVKAIVNELGNEQIDIIEWSEIPAQLIVNALSPAKVVSAMADEDERKAQIVVSEQQLSLAIGKSGQNVRLAAKLTGYGIDIKSEAQAGMMETAEEAAEEYDDIFDEADMGNEAFDNE